MNIEGNILFEVNIKKNCKRITARNNTLIEKRINARY